MNITNANITQNNLKDDEDEKLSKLDVDLIYRDCDKDRVNKTIIRNLIDTESISMRNQSFESRSNNRPSGSFNSVQSSGNQRFSGTVAV